MRLFGVGLRDTIHLYLYRQLRESMIWLHFLGRLSITLIRFITMFYGIDSISHNILHIHTDYGEYLKTFYEILPVPQNIFMDLNNVMSNTSNAKYVEILSSRILGLCTYNLRDVSQFIRVKSSSSKWLPVEIHFYYYKTPVSHPPLSQFNRTFHKSNRLP